MLGSWLGWASVASFLLALGNYLIRKMKCKKQFHLLRGKHHRIWGVLMTAAGILHGVISTFLVISIGVSPASILTILTGMIILLSAVKLWHGFVHRAGKKNWLQKHRYTALFMIPLLIVHIWIHVRSGRL